MKQKLSLILLMALIASAVSCGDTAQNNPESSGDTSAEETTVVVEKDYLDTLSTDKFSGRTLRIFDANDHPEMHINVALDEQNGDLVNDALYNRDLLMENTFGVTIEYTKSPGKANAACRQLDQCVLAGDNEWEFVYSCLLGGALTSSATSGTLANLCDIEALQLDKDWWSSLLYDSFRLNDTMYFSTGDVSPAMYQGVYVVFANSRLMEENKIDADELMTLALDGKWTLDKLLTTTKDLFRDTNNDGVMDMADDFFGHCFHTNQRHVLDAAGVSVVRLNDDKTGFELDFDNEHNISVVDKLKSYYVKSVNNNSNPNEGPKLMFKEGRCVFFTHAVEVAMSHFRDMEDDYIILPMPKADENQENYISTFSGWISSYVSIPLTADKDFAGTMLEAMAYIGRRDIRPKAYELAYKAKSASDERSAEILDLCLDTAYIDFNSIYNFGNSYSIVDSASCGNGELVSGLASVRTATEEAINKFVESWSKK